MPNPLRLARALALVACALAGFATYAAWHQQWVAVALLGYGAGIAYLGSRLEYRGQRRIRAEAARAERMARPYHPEPPPLTPCCQLWVQSRGGVHDDRRRCTRPLAARSQLSTAEQEAFAAIARTFDETRDSA
jgi:hypothetical protein